MFILKMLYELLKAAHVRMMFQHSLSRCWKSVCVCEKLSYRVLFWRGVLVTLDSQSVQWRCKIQRSLRNKVRLILIPWFVLQNVALHIYYENYLKMIHVLFQTTYSILSYPDISIELDRKQPWPCYLSAWWVFTHRFLDNFQFKKQLEGGNQWIQYGYAWRVYSISRWWFQIFCIFTPTWGNDPIGLIFFKWVKTTN